MLCSINTQVNIPFECVEVIIVNDGTEPLDESFLTKYNNLLHHEREGVDPKFSNGIKYFKKEGRHGPGPTRQYGIDRATGEYIMLFDADDMLYCVNALYKFFNVFHTIQQDVVIDMVIANHCQSNLDTNYKPNTVNSTFLYPKAIRRGFLLENNIRFLEDTFMFDDVYFSGLLYAYKPKAVQINEVLYMRVVGNGKFSLMSDHQNVEHEYLYAYVETTMKLAKELKTRGLDFMNTALSEFVILFYHYNKILSMPKITNNISTSFNRSIAVFKKFLIDEFEDYKNHLSNECIFKRISNMLYEKVTDFHLSVTFSTFVNFVENFDMSNYETLITFKPTYNSEKKYPYLYNIGLYEVNERNDKIDYFNFVKDTSGEINPLDVFNKITPDSPTAINDLVNTFNILSNTIKNIGVRINELKPSISSDTNGVYSSSSSDVGTICQEILNETGCSDVDI
jgi:hypothetical protein